jgi:hypothetical protein
LRSVALWSTAVYIAYLAAPGEIDVALELFIDGLQWPADRKRRDPTDFEVGWFQETHALLRR